MDIRSNEIAPSLGHDWVNIVNIRLWLSLIDSISQKTQPWPINFFQCSGESTTTECGVNYLQRAVITEVAKWGTPSCSRPQPATDNGVRDDRYNLLVAIPTIMGSTP